MKSKCIELVFVLLLVTRSLQQTQDVYGLINVLYLKADANRNGEITLAELTTIYHGFDQNNDNKITQKEFTTVWQSITQMTKDVTNAYFHLVDFDQNNLIENSDINKLYLRFDLNNNCMVEAEEFNLKWQSIYKEVPFTVLFLRADVNKGGYLTQQEFINLLHTFDTDNNLSISKKELENGWFTEKFGHIKDADYLFNSLNKDGTGGISADDMTKVFKQYDVSHNNKMEILEITEMRSLTGLTQG
ncbi:hypothetical protein SNE40_002512 [Patella caerulea]|uniref:EF-hand domain-containing protein n=1 Tax=Patella caerulea TaxID=87958 RepID=A0AAN8KCC9_PATCE